MISKNKSILKQLTEALELNSVPVVLPGTFATPGLNDPNGVGSNTANFSGDPIAIENQWLNNIETAMIGAGVSLTTVTFATGEDDNQSVRIAKVANQRKLDLQAADFLK